MNKAVCGQNTDSSKSGVWFVKRQNVYLMEGSWRVAIIINVTDVTQEISLLQEVTQEARQLLTKVTVYHPELEINQASIQYLSSLQNELLLASRSLTSLLPNHRSKRGLFNAGGMVLNFLFGVAEDEDLQETNLAVGKVENQIADIIHINGEHLTITRKLNTQLTKTTTELLDLVTDFKEFAQTIERRLNKVENQVEKLGKLVANQINISATLQQLEISTLKGLIDVKSLVQALENLGINRLSLNLIKPSEFLKILAHVQSSIGKERYLALGSDAISVYKYYELCSIRTLASMDLIEIFVDVPLARQERPYELFQTYSMKIKDEATGVIWKYQLDNPYFLVSEDRTSYTLLDRHYLVHCKQYGFLLCPARLPLYSRLHTTCESALYFGEDEKVIKLCMRTAIMGETDTPEWQWDSEHFRWLYSVMKPTTLISRCQEGERLIVNETALTGIGSIQASRQCTLGTEKYTLPTDTRHEGVSVLQKRVLVISKPTQLHIDTRTEHLDAEVLSEVYQRARKDGRVGRHQGDYTVKLEQLVRMNEQILAEKTLMKVTYGGLSMTSLIAAAVVVVVLLFRRRRRLQRGPAQDGESKADTSKDIAVFHVHKLPVEEH